MITLIAACSKNRAIGKENRLLWKIPNDLKRFKELTNGHPVLMGRKTYESIGRPLPNRKNLVVTKDQDFSQIGCFTYNDLNKAIIDHTDDLFIIGGGEIYNQTISLADRIELTQVFEDFEGDSFFPEIPSTFSLIWKSGIQYTESGLSYEFLTFAKTFSGNSVK